MQSGITVSMFIASTIVPIKDAPRIASKPISIDRIKRHASYFQNVQGVIKERFQIIELCLTTGIRE